MSGFSCLRPAFLTCCPLCEVQPASLRFTEILFPHNNRCLQYNTIIVCEFFRSSYLIPPQSAQISFGCLDLVLSGFIWLSLARGSCVACFRTTEGVFPCGIHPDVGEGVHPEPPIKNWVGYHMETHPESAH